MLFDPIYMVILVVFMVIGLLVQFRLRNVFHTYGKVAMRANMSGKEVADKMLRDNGIYDVKVTSVEGRLTDHYNPQNRTVNLSPDVYDGRSITAAAVAAHECGHALQHAQLYGPLNLRSKLVPLVNFASVAMNFIYIGMIFLAFSYQLYNQALIAIIIAQSVITLFAVVTLPVEIDASRRALAWLNTTGISHGEEKAHAEKALRWVAMTYIVAALASIAQLFYFIMQLNRRSE